MVQLFKGNALCLSFRNLNLVKSLETKMSSRSRFRGTSVLSCRRTATGKAVTFYTGNSKIIVSVGGEEVSPIRGRNPVPYGTWERVGQFSSVPQSCLTL